MLRIKSSLIAILTMLSLYGCASSSQTYTQSGAIGHNINCSGVARNWGMCFEKAGELCKTSGYRILQATTDNGIVINAESRSLNAMSTISRNLLIQCN